MKKKTRGEYDFAALKGGTRRKYLNFADLDEADRLVKSGHHIRHEDMKAWLLSWGTDHELPLPKCVCGAEHGDKPP
jgi:hypothetical protein